MARRPDYYNDSVKRIRKMMQEAGIYEARYEIQIEQTADTMLDIKQLRETITREGRTTIEEKTGGVGAKVVAHPLLAVLNNAQKLLIQQLAALGLNKLSEKKSETKEAKRAEKDGVQAFFEGRRGG